jgi:hypothetical protein
MVINLKVVEDKEDWGMFIDSCFTHCQTLYGTSWNSPISPRLGNKVWRLKCTRLCTLSLTHHVTAWIDIFLLPFWFLWRRLLQRLLEIGTLEGGKKWNWLTASIRATQHAAVCYLHDLLLHWSASRLLCKE